MKLKIFSKGRPASQNLTGSPPFFNISEFTQALLLVVEVNLGFGGPRSTL